MSHLCDGRDLTCGSCMAMAKRHEVVRAALTVDDQLDDITRAQIWSRLESQLGTTVARAARWPARVAMAAALAAGVVIAVAVTRGDRDPGAGVFVAPRETTLSLRLGHARASLVGPARLDVLDATPAATSVRLLDGTLLAEFEGGQGRSLRIMAPGATIEIVGTLFAVAVHAGTTCVSVAHGTVRMTTATRTLTIAGGQRGCSDGRAQDALDPAMREVLTRHAATITADLGPVPLPRPIEADQPVATPPVIAPVIAPVIEPVIAPPPARSPAVQPELRPRSVVPAVAAPRAIAVAPPVAAPSVAAPRVAAPRVAAPAVAAPAVATPRVAAPPVATPAVAAPAVAASPVAAPPPRSIAPEPSSPPPIPPPVAPPATAASLYRDAEASLAARDLPAADRHLATLLSQFPESALLDQALYERARIAYRQHAWADAQRQLDRLSIIQASPLAEPGAYLSCRIAFEASDGGAAACLTSYRARYPRSPHDADVLGMLAEFAFRSGGCANARAGITELTRLYPDTARTQDWHRRCPETP
jgi:TolA-binding protein